MFGSAGGCMQIAEGGAGVHTEACTRGPTHVHFAATHAQPYRGIIIRVSLDNHEKPNAV